MKPGRRISWFLVLAACVVAGVGFGVANARGAWLPSRVGYGLALAAWLGGLAFGLRAVWLPFAGIGAFGVATFVAATLTPSSGEDQRALVVLFLTVIPALFAVPALLGAGIRRLLRRRSPGDAQGPPASA
jgi:hypothetical protein